MDDHCFPKDASTPIVPPRNAFLELIAYVEEARDLFSLCHFAISGVTGVARLGIAINNSGDKTVYTGAQIAEMQELEVRAKAEVNSGFARISAHALVSIWGAFEASFYDFCILLLLAETGRLNNPEMRKIKLPVSHLIDSNRRNSMSAVLNEIKQQVLSVEKAGAGRFTSILKYLGISVSLDEEAKHTLYFTSKLRNLIVHRFGIADSQFVSDCGWLGLTVGERVPISIDQLGKSTAAILRFAADILEAIPDVDSKPPPPSR